MMRKMMTWSVSLLLFALLLTVLIAYFYPGDTFEQLAIGDGEGYWINCGSPPRCRVALPFSPRMNDGEKSFLARLDTIPVPPVAVSKEQLIAIVGRPPDRIEPGEFARLEWRGTPGEGTETERFLVVSLYAGQLGRVHWQTGRFSLYKKFDVGPRIYKGGGKPRPAS